MGSGVTVGRRGGVLKSERPKGTDTKSLAVWSVTHRPEALTSLGGWLDNQNLRFHPV